MYDDGPLQRLAKVIASAELCTWSYMLKPASRFDRFDGFQKRRGGFRQDFLFAAALIRGLAFDLSSDDEEAIQLGLAAGIIIPQGGQAWRQMFVGPYTVQVMRVRRARARKIAYA